MLTIKDRNEAIERGLEALASYTWTGYCTYHEYESSPCCTAWNGDVIYRDVDVQDLMDAFHKVLGE